MNSLVLSVIHWRVCTSVRVVPYNLFYAEDIKIGLAVFTAETCLRMNEVDCTYCVDTCPIGERRDSSYVRGRCRGD